MSYAELTQERLKELLSYSKRTGVFKWRRSITGRIVSGAVAGCVNKSGYTVIGIDRVIYYAHRLAWLYVIGSWPSEEIDHKIGKSNKWGNLREANSSLNKENQRSSRSNNKSTGLLGAYKYKRRFKSSIGVHWRQLHLGVFDTAKQAHHAYVEAKRRLHDGCTI